MVIGEERFTGDYCARLEGKDSYIEQIVTGLQPNTSYILTAKVKSQFKKQYVILGVKDFGGTDLNTSANSTEYIKLTLIFRTGKENESAKIYIKSLNNGYCYR